MRSRRRIGSRPWGTFPNVQSHVGRHPLAGIRRIRHHHRHEGCPRLDEPPSEQGPLTVAVHAVAFAHRRWLAAQVERLPSRLAVEDGEGSPDFDGFLDLELGDSLSTSCESPAPSDASSARGNRETFRVSP